MELISSAGDGSAQLSVEPDGTRTGYHFLEAGETVLRFTAVGNEESRVEIQIFLDGSLFESVHPNGVGQGPALGLMAISRTGTSLGLSSPVRGVSPEMIASSPLGTWVPGPSLGLSTPSQPVPVENGGPAPQGTTLGTAVEVPLLLVAGSQLVGMPSASASRILPVGPGLGTSVALGSGVGEGQGGSRGLTTAGVVDELAYDSRHDQESVEASVMLMDSEGAMPGLEGALASASQMPGTVEESGYLENLSIAVDRLERLVARVLEGGTRPESLGVLSFPEELAGQLSTLLLVQEGFPDVGAEVEEQPHVLADFRPSLEMAFLAVVMIQFRERIAQQLQRYLSWSRKHRKPGRELPGWTRENLA